MTEVKVWIQSDRTYTVRYATGDNKFGSDKNASISVMHDRDDDFGE